MCDLWSLIAQIQQLANQPNGQTRMDNERRLQEQKQRIEQDLAAKAQDLQFSRVVSYID